MKYRAITKKRKKLLQTIKWTGNSYALETHVSNHRQAYDDLMECSTHITVHVSSDPQRVEYLIDSIISKDSTLQASIGLVRANTNNMRNNFEGVANILIEIDPYRRSKRSILVMRMSLLLFLVLVGGIQELISASILSISFWNYLKTKMIN